MGNPSSGNQASTALTKRLYQFAWPLAELDDALRLVAQKLKVPTTGEGVSDASHPVDVSQDKEALEQWVDDVASWFQLEAEAVHTPYAAVDTLIRQGGPALFRLRNETPGGEPRFLVLLKTGQWKTTVLSADSKVHRVKPDHIRAAFCHDLEAPLLPEIEAFLSEMKWSGRQRTQARRALLAEKLYEVEISGCWLLNTSPSIPFWTQARQVHLQRDIWLFISCQLLRYLMVPLVWSLIAISALRWEIEWTILTLSILLMVSRIPLAFAAEWMRQRFEEKFSPVLRRWMFAGTLRLDLDVVRQRGTGQFLAWLLESGNMEETGLRGGSQLLRSVASLTAIVVALMFIGEPLLGTLLLGWMMLFVLMGWDVARHYARLNSHYVGMTTDLLERLRGHQTRLMQEQNWYDNDDVAIDQYLALERAYGRRFVRVQIFIPYGWLITALACIGPNFIFGNVGISLLSAGLIFAALLVGFKFLNILTFIVLSELVQVFASRSLGGMTSSQAEKPSSVQMGKKNHDKSVAIAPTQSEGPIIDVRDVVFGYHAHRPPSLNGCKLQMHAGDRWLLEGPSGSGKSTLAAILTGLKTPTSGLLFLKGLDRYSLGDVAWRNTVVTAPQFHENHVLGASMAFNLLMGRRWPPAPTDLAEAETVLRELGLGELLDRMPRGLQQKVGEEGWQLSHGERSRLYIARAILQDADVMILDESFASLDPESLQVALQCVLDRAPTLLVIAHP